MAPGWVGDPNLLIWRLTNLIPGTFYSNQLQRGIWRIELPILGCNFTSFPGKLQEVKLPCFNKRFFFQIFEADIWGNSWVNFWSALFLVLASLAGVSASLLSDGWQWFSKVTMITHSEGRAVVFLYFDKNLCLHGLWPLDPTTRQVWLGPPAFCIEA